MPTKITEERFSRIFGIIGTLSPYSQVTVKELATEYEVSAKTIQRDIKALQNAKLGVFYENRKLKISRTGYKRIRSWILG